MLPKTNSSFRPRVQRPTYFTCRCRPNTIKASNSDIRRISYSESMPKAVNPDAGRINVRVDCSKIAPTGAFILTKIFQIPYSQIEVALQLILSASIRVFVIQRQITLQSRLQIQRALSHLSAKQDQFIRLSVGRVKNSASAARGLH